MSTSCLPAGLTTLAQVEPGTTVEIRGMAGRDSARCPLPTGAIVQILGRTGNTVRVRLSDGGVLLIDVMVAALLRVEHAGACGDG